MSKVGVNTIVFVIIAQGVVKVKFAPEEAMKTQRRSRDIAPDGGGWLEPRPGHFTPENDPVPIV